MRASDEGIYVVLERDFVTENGVFVAHPAFTVPSKAGAEPEYVRLKGRVYAYSIKG